MAPSRRITKGDPGNPEFQLPIDCARRAVEERAIDRELELRIARIAFGDSTARRHSLDEDPQLQKALELLRRGSTQQDLFALVTAKR